MSISQELQLFCIKYNLEFPDFEIISIDCHFICNIRWYKNLIITTHLYNTQELCLNSALLELDNWLKSNFNFINLMLLRKQYNKI